ncbi:MAG: SpaA isopeptide-forming pilin-related protein [Peptococcaceae bacterium]|nr:SpaA isopeptide-forming pilin-related protein [Peptococcaceae bacterium]
MLIVLGTMVFGGTLLWGAPTGNFSFTVVDDDRKPISGLEFTLTYPNSNETYSAISDSEGQVSFTDVPDGDRILSTIYEGYEATALLEDKDADLNSGNCLISVTIQKNSTENTINFCLNQIWLGNSKSFTFTVLDDEGNPLSDVTFSLVHQDTGEIYKATSSSEGLVNFEDVPRGDMVLSTTYEGYEASLSLRVTQENSSSDRDIIIQKNDTGNGIDLIFGNARGWSPATCFAFDVRDISNSSAPVQGTEFTLTYPDGSTYTAKSDAQGTVTFTNIPAGKATLTEKVPAGYTPDKTITLDLKEGDTNKLPTAYQDNILPVRPLPSNTHASKSEDKIPLMPIAGV